MAKLQKSSTVEKIIVDSDGEEEEQKEFNIINLKDSMVRPSILLP